MGGTGLCPARASVLNLDTGRRLGAESGLGLYGDLQPRPCRTSLPHRGGPETAGRRKEKL
jgi:hypothetical protein